MENGFIQSKFLVGKSLKENKFKMGSTWYFYWHNKLTDEKGVFDGYMDYVYVKDMLYTFAEDELKDCHWLVTEEKSDGHPCKEQCSCEPLSEVWLPLY
jgi:hypothetical protein